MCLHRIFLGGVLAAGLAATAVPVTAIELLAPQGSDTWLDAPAFVGSGSHGEDRHHRHENPDRWRHDWHRHGHRRGSGKGYLTLYTLEHRHDGLGWHVHREWRRQRHRAPPNHGPRRNDDWEDGAGIALGVLAGMFLLNQFADGGNAAGASGHIGTHSRGLDVHSRQRQSQAIRDALDAGGSSVATWSNPMNRNGSASGEVRITRNGRDSYGNPCREYHQTLRVGNWTEQGRAVACRDRKGIWHLQP